MLNAETRLMRFGIRPPAFDIDQISGSSTQFNGARPAELFDFFDQLFRRSYALRDVRFHPEPRDAAVPDIEFERNLAIAAMPRQQLGERFECGPRRPRQVDDDFPSGALP